MQRWLGSLFLVFLVGCQGHAPTIAETQAYHKRMHDTDSVEYRDRVERNYLLQKNSAQGSRVNVDRPESPLSESLVSSVISSVLNPASNEKVYQFNIRLQCEFKRHLHLPLKGKKFQWEIVGFTQGEGVTDLDGRAMVSLKSAIDPTFINIYYQDKKYRFGAYDNVVVNIQDCEI